MQKNLIELIEDISEKGEQVVASAEELMATSHESSMSAEEIAQAIEDIAQGASEQASDTEKGATIVGELGEQIVENLQELELLNKVINQILELKDEGLETVKTLVEKTEESAAAASEIHENILHTNESAVQIGNAAKMVESIANQTNLLALNAAIEAARAGEAGRGFAVVADEIRKLAEESNMFTKEIHKVIQELMEKTAAGVETMESVGAIVRAQNESVDMTNNQFNGIAKAIENMQNSLEDFNKSMDKIETSKDGTLNVIQNLSAIAQENAAGTEEASASVEEQTAATEQISDASSALAELSEEMQEAIGRFKF
ncbi:MAG TPA: hypothetical protein GX526_05560 [Thermoanaerobacterales bacterium]|nr:hypothetical protein [Thermoanaerobacterales bacterium]